MTCTASGLTCQYWNVNSPHNPLYSPSDPADKTSNYCRDPSGDGIPWCYTTDPNMRYDYCAVPKCPS